MVLKWTSDVNGQSASISVMCQSEHCGIRHRTVNDKQREVQPFVVRNSPSMSLSVLWARGTPLWCRLDVQLCLLKCRFFLPTIAPACSESPATHMCCRQEIQVHRAENSAARAWAKRVNFSLCCRTWMRKKTHTLRLVWRDCDTYCHWGTCTVTRRFKLTGLKTKKHELSTLLHLYSPSERDCARKKTPRPVSPVWNALGLSLQKLSALFMTFLHTDK